MMLCGTIVVRSNEVVLESEVEVDVDGVAASTARAKEGGACLLLDVVENDSSWRAQDQACSTTVEDLVSLDRRLDRFDYRVRQIPDFNELKENDQLHQLDNTTHCNSPE